MEANCNNVLKYINEKNSIKAHMLESYFNDVNLINCIDELIASNFIIIQDGTYFIEPFGRDIYKNYTDYEVFKKDNFIEYDRNYFINDVEAELIKYEYQDIDILPIIRKYTICKGFDDIMKIRGKMSDSLSQLKKSNEIYYQNVDSLRVFPQRTISKNSIIIRGTENFYKKRQDEEEKNKASLLINKQIEDFPKAKSNRRWVLILAALAVLVTLITWIIDKLTK